jgi:ssDNA-binding Zn-finger/Zn-ribbon topoisomerase 1
MPTLLEKLGATKNETRPENAPTNPTNQARTNYESRPAGPAPCPDCGSLLAWQDHYGRDHCFGCEPYPSERLVAGLYVAHEGRWMTPREERALRDQPPGQDAVCGHHRLRKVVTVAGCGFQLDPAPEVYYECQACGWWFTEEELAEQSAP